MTYKLPFGLTQKPVNKYFQGGVIKFSCREGVLHYTVKQITKKSNALLLNGIVKSKEHLQQLLAVKSLNDIPTLENVKQ